MPSMIPYGNVQGMLAYQRTLTPVAVAANTAAEQSFTIPGLLASDFVVVSKPSAQAGLGIVNVRVSAKDTLAITYSNGTASSITPTAEAYKLLIHRVDNGNYSPSINF